MANRRQLVKRRRTVGNIRKITRTMQLIATARFQKSLNRANATKPYAKKLAHMLAVSSKQVGDLEHPLLKTNDSDKSAIIVITSNRGLCGGYNGNVLRRLLVELKQRQEAGETVDVHVMGKKGINYLRFLGRELASARTDIDDQPRFEQIAPLAQSMMDAYAEGRVASVHVCYMQFISTSRQQPEMMQLLPFVDSSEDGNEEEGTTAAATGPMYDFAPDAEELLRELLPATVRMRLFEAFSDAAVSEQVARMIAMKAATDAAGDMIKILTQQYNRARQTSITMELLDIVGGAAAIS